MEWLGPTLKPYDLLPRDTGGHAAASAQSVAAPASEPDSASEFHVSFDDLLDIVNPLQHLPVVGTLYRAVTHDAIKTPEKIAGDTLYGGLWGFVSSVADTAFEKITGRNFGDTVLALFTGSHDTPAAVAGNAPASQTAAAATSPQATGDVAALTQSLERSGVDSGLAQRALYAYRRGNALLASAAPSPF